MTVRTDPRRERPKPFADDWASAGTPRPPTTISNPLGAGGRVAVADLAPTSVGGRFRRYSPEEIASVPSVHTDGGIDLSPDGAEVAFAWDRTGAAEIYAAPLVGDRIIQLTAAGGYSRAPRWSPDARSIAFLRSDADGRDAIWLVDRDGEHERRLTSDAGYGDHAWSPDGTRIAAAADDGSVRIVDVSSGDARRLASGSQPRWSPDGTVLLAADGDLGVVAASGGTVRALGIRDGADVRIVDASWSSDGSAIAFTRVARGRSAVAFAVVRDGAVVRIERPGATPFADSGPTWRPDGRGIVYRRAAEANVALRRVFTVSHTDEAVADMPGVHSSPRVAPDSETVVAVLSQPTRPADVVVRARGAIEIARITSSLPAGMDAGAFVEPVPVVIGVGRLALVYVPRAEAGAPKPTVVLYDRPATREWDPISQLLANGGHVVVAASIDDPSEMDPVVDRLREAGLGNGTTRQVAAPADLARAPRAERIQLLQQIAGSGA